MKLVDCNILSQGAPIKETYHRLLDTIKADLLHKDAEDRFRSRRLGLALS